MDWPRIVQSFCWRILALPAPAVRLRIRSGRGLTTRRHSSMLWDLHTSMSSVSRSADTSRRPLRSATPNSYAGSFLSAPSPVRATTEIGTPMSTTLLPETKCSLSRTSVSYSSYRRRPAKPRVNDSGSTAINGRWTWIRPHPSSRCRPGQPRSSTGSSHMVSRSRN